MAMPRASLNQNINPCCKIPDAQEVDSFEVTLSSLIRFMPVVCDLCFLLVH